VDVVAPAPSQAPFRTVHFAVRAAANNVIQVEVGECQLKQRTKQITRNLLGVVGDDGGGGPC
jgi:hypothetical protein